MVFFRLFAFSEAFFRLKMTQPKFCFLSSNRKNLQCQKRKTNFLGFEDFLIGSKFLLKWLKISDNYLNAIFPYFQRSVG